MANVGCGCGARFQVNAVPGQTVACPQCGKPVAIPIQQRGPAQAPPPPAGPPVGALPPGPPPNSGPPGPPPNSGPSGPGPVPAGPPVAASNIPPGPPVGKPAAGRPPVPLSAAEVNMPAAPTGPAQVVQPVAVTPVAGGLPGKPPAPVAPKKSGSARLWSGLGGVAAVVVVLAYGVYRLDIPGWLALGQAASHVTGFSSEFTEQGYKPRIGQILSITDPITEPTVVTCQVLHVKADVDANLAIMAQLATLEGNVNGDIDFKGQSLTIGRDSVVNGDIHCHFAQAVIVMGKHNGKVTGQYQLANSGRAGNGGNGADDQAARRTQAQMRKLVERINAQAVRDGALPNDQAGARLAASVRDEWGNAVRYEQNSATNYALRSAGPDGTWNNDDDVLERGRARLSIASRITGGGGSGSDTSSAPPKDAAAALEYIESPGRLRRVLGLDWLIAQKPALAGEQRRRVVVATARLLEDRSLATKAKTALLQWANRDDVDVLTEAAQRIRSTADATTFIEILTRMDGAAGVAAFVNHADAGVRKQAEAALRTLQVPEEVILRQCVRDLENATRRQHALARITRHPEVEQPLRGQLSLALLKLLVGDASTGPGGLSMGLNPLDPAAPKINVRVPRRPGRTNAGEEAAFAALEVLGFDYEHVPLLVTLLDSGHPLALRAAKQLVELRDPRGFPSLVNWTARQRGYSDQKDAIELLQPLGSLIEPYVWPVLESNTRRANEAACKLLAKVGTRDSIKRLETLAERPGNSEAGSALRVIQAANRQPVRIPEQWLPELLTRRAIDRVEATVTGHVETQGKLPVDDEAKALLGSQRDGWGGELRLKAGDNQNAFAVSSAGPDKQWDTDDDVVETSPPAAPQDIEQVVRALRSPDRSHPRAALAWLEREQPIEAEHQRGVMVGLLLLLNDREFYQAVKTQLLRVVEPADAAMIANAMDNYKAVPVRMNWHGRTLVELLAKIKAKDQLLPLINHSDESTRTAALGALQGIGGVDDELVQQCLADITELGAAQARVVSAIQRLEKIDIPAAQHDAVRSGAKLLLSRHEQWMDRSALRVILKLGIREADFPMYREVLDNGHLRHELARALGQSKQEKSLSFLAQALNDDDWPKATTAASGLAAAGAAGEKYLWAGLKVENAIVRRSTCGALGIAGTAASIPQLETLAGDPDAKVVEAAQKAITAIRAR